jgi:ABC-2 type transport system permease protein
MTEFSKLLQAPAEFSYYLVGVAVFVVLLILNNDGEVAGTGVARSSFIFPGGLAFIIVFMAAFGLAIQMTTEREDGTLLRAKAVPHGIIGYVVGQVTRTLLEAAFTLAVLTVPAVIILGPTWSNGPVGVVHMIALVLLGLLACVPLGFALGCLFKNPRSVGGWGFLVMAGLVMISGLFPSLTLPDWVHGVAQALPLYWLGLGMRAAILPDTAAVLEIGGRWRTLEVFAVLGSWAAVGLILALILLRRTARQQTGSAVSTRRQQATQRI